MHGQTRTQIRMNPHAFQRADERLVGNELTAVQNNIRKAAAKHGSKSLAVIAHRLEDRRGQAWGQKSNGDCVVAIIRNGAVKTVYLRRATQTFNLGVTRTDVLVDMTGTVLQQPLTNGRRSAEFNPFSM